MAPVPPLPGGVSIPRRLIVGIDGSAGSREALRWASRLAAGLDAEIVVVHALGLLEDVDGETVSADAARDKIAALVAQDWCAGLPASRTIVRDGPPVDVLAAVAREEAANLLIVGRRGSGDLPALALGSTSLQLLRVAPVPVLVVPTREDGGCHLSLSRVMVAVDSDAPPDRAIRLARLLASTFGAQVELVHAVEDVPVLPLGPATRTSVEGEVGALGRTRAQLLSLRTELTGSGVPAHVTVRRGVPEEVVRSVAAELDTDLVVLSSCHVGQPTEPLLGSSVSRRIVHLAHRPTLVVPVPSSAGVEARRGRATAGVAGRGRDLDARLRRGEPATPAQVRCAHRV